MNRKRVSGLRALSLTWPVLAVLLCLSGVAAHAAATLSTEHVDVRLLTGQTAAVPGSTVWVALDFRLKPEWHVYWRNPGDSGEPPRVDWQLPKGWSAGDIQWPLPERIPVGPFVNYGYAQQVTFLIPLRLKPDSATQAATLAAYVHWLVCREECIPEQGRLELTLPVNTDAAKVTADNQAVFRAARERLPLEKRLHADYRLGTPGRLELRLPATGWRAERLADVWFAANAWGPIAAAGRQTWHNDGDDLLIDVPLGDVPPSEGAALPGLLVVTEQTADATLRRGYVVDAKARIDAIAGPDAAQSLSFATAMLFAFAGGLLLNLMPCVLPVLAIKVLGLVRHAGPSAPRHGLAYAAGVLGTFAALAALLIALRGVGHALGWGFQLQEPIVVILLLYLMLAIALNLSGVFEVGERLQGAGQRLTERGGYAGSFASGMLAVVVASPCTAPFMGGALGFALTRPAGEALAVFLALGLGFALPLLSLSARPAWLARLPSPGQWMEQLRRLLAFPLYAAAAWLLWVLSQQVDSSALALAMSGALLLAFALWWFGQRHALPRTARLFGVGGTALSLLLAVLAAAGGPSSTNLVDSVEHWRPSKVEELLADGRSVLVNFTAAWCITCQVNERIALSGDVFHAAMASRQVAYLKGDWTSRDASITAELQRHGRSGVPLYLLYANGDPSPQVLPQLLSQERVLQALNSIPAKE